MRGIESTRASLFSFLFLGWPGSQHCLSWTLLVDVCVSSFWRLIVVGSAAVSYSHFASSAPQAHGLRAGHEGERQCNWNAEHTPSRDASNNFGGCAVPRRYGGHHDELDYNDERNDKDSEETHTFHVT